MRVALVHDDLVQWGGAERMLLALAQIFPDAPIFTSVYDRSNPLIDQNFKGRDIRTSFIQKIPGRGELYKKLLPLYPIAFEQFDFDGYDFVISQTTRFAKAIITKPQTTHVCYCHTPPRFLWNLTSDFKEVKLLKPYFNWLRRYDLITSTRVDKWIAGSLNAQSRIKKIYGASSEVIYPFVDLQDSARYEVFEGGYLLVISRLNKYKRVDLVIKAASKLDMPLKIVGIGPEMSHLAQGVGSNIEFLGVVEDKLLYELIAGCTALVVAAEEDFGLTPLEAQAFGKPVIGYKKGGVLETVIDGSTGYLFDEQSIDSLAQALQKFKKYGYNKKKCLDQASKFSKERFKSQFRSLLKN